MLGDGIMAIISMSNMRRLRNLFWLGSSWPSNTQSGGMTLFVCLPDDLLTGTFARWKTQGESTHCIIMAKNQSSRTSQCFEITEKGLNLQHCGEGSELYSKYQNQ